MQNSVLEKLKLPDSTVNRDLVKDWINRAYHQACIETQAFQRTGYDTLTAGSPSYTLPAEVAEIKKITIRGFGGTADGSPLTPTPLQQILEWRQAGGGANATTGPTTNYALMGLNQLELYPTPASADRIYLWYVYLPTKLTAVSDVPELPEPYASNILEYGALAHAAEMRADPLGPTWRSQYEEWKLRMRVHMNRRGGVSDQFPIDNGNMPAAHDPSTVGA